jgi:hypothetical protein
MAKIALEGEKTTMGFAGTQPSEKIFEVEEFRPGCLTYRFNHDAFNRASKEQRNAALSEFFSGRTPPHKTYKYAGVPAVA